MREAQVAADQSRKCEIKSVQRQVYLRGIDEEPVCQWSKRRGSGEEEVRKGGLAYRAERSIIQRNE